MNKTPQRLKGFRDFLPSDMRVRSTVINSIQEVFESFGFEELQTPVLETQDVLLGKYGEEAERLMYLFEDQGKRKVGMRYDLTVPLARVAATNQDLPKPFKRYQIQPVWRAENTQKGRYREFYQCDVDTLGSNSPLSDAEIIAVIDAVFKKLNFKEFSIRVNSRSVLFSVMGQAGVTQDQWMAAIQSIDKLDKKSQDEVEEELLRKGMSNQTVNKIFNNLKIAKPDSYLEETMNYAIKLGVNKENLIFDPVLSRGLDYYTGPIFESVVKEPKIGSLTGGGRYDKLLKTIGGPDIPAVGTTIGLERIIDVLAEIGKVQSIESSVEVLVTIIDPLLIDETLSLVKDIRERNINVELYANPQDRIGKQLKYADKKGIRCVLILGEQEVSQNKVTVKNMISGESNLLSFEEFIQSL